MVTCKTEIATRMRTCSGFVYDNRRYMDIGRMSINTFIELLTKFDRTIREAEAKRKVEEIHGKLQDL